MKNEYLDAFHELFHNMDHPDLLCSFSQMPWNNWYDKRVQYCRRYAWGIPNDEALKAIAAYGPVVEMGAGSGYWARLLSERGVDVVAYDNRSTHTFIESHFPVHQGEPPHAARHANRTLLLVWPPYGSPMATQCVKHWRGDVLAYVGEHNGCTAHESFEVVLDKLFEQIDEVSLPQWPGLHDELRIFKRKHKTRTAQALGRDPRCSNPNQIREP